MQSVLWCFCICVFCCCSRIQIVVEKILTGRGIISLSTLIALEDVEPLRFLFDPEDDLEEVEEEEEEEEVEVAFLTRFDI